MKITVINARELSEEDVRLWSALQDSNAALASPYFSPEFTQAVAAVRDDVFAAVMEEAGRIVGFFPFQKGPLRTGRPAGGALSDYQAVIAAADTQWDAQDLIAKCGLALWDFDHLLASQAPFAAYHRVSTGSPFLDLSNGYEA